ncbi:MAG: hypothetical protein LBD24_09475 [Spirochaetaceae bacterium]|nr:hypothetical protein [Spirochaetaceae bacterium]
MDGRSGAGHAFQGNGTALPSGETMRILPEGTRKRDVIEVVAPRALTFFVADPATQRPSDRLVWWGVEYVITGAGLHPHGISAHLQGRMRRLRPVSDAASGCSISVMRSAAKRATTD